jgi:lambda family phage portal protein
MWPFTRKKEKTKRAYAGAMIGRLVSDWIAMGTSSDAEIRGSLASLRNRCRQLERDNDYIRSYLREVEINVIGQGIPFQSQIKMQRGNKLNDTLNSLVEEKWSRWCKKGNCEVSGKLSFYQVERLVVRSIARDGDILIRKVRQPFGKSKVPLGLEIMEADLLDENYSGVAPSGNAIRMGVEVSNWGQPVAYYFLTSHPGDYQFSDIQSRNGLKHIRVPAEDIIHPFLTERAGQTRGVPWISSAITKLHHLNGYQEACVIRARTSAATMGFIESPDGELRSDDVIDGSRVQDFSPGAWHYLGPGEKVNIPPLNSQGTEFQPFMSAMLRGTAAGVGCSYETISKDYSQSNYSSSRLALISDRDHWRCLQDWIIDHFHQVVFEEWLDLAVLSGELNLPGYETNAELYRDVRWTPRGWAWVDPQREVIAAKEMIIGGLTSVSKVVAQQGDDPAELFQEIKRERDLAQSLGLKFDTDVDNTKMGASVSPAQFVGEANDVKL